MNVAMVNANPIDRSLAGDAARTNASSGDFSATIAAELGDRGSTLERAEELIGSRIRAPEGGCGCDALVGTVVQSPTASPMIDRSPALPMTPAPASVSPQIRDVSPGRILEFDDANDLGDHLHRAILRNATEMIAANRSGLVEVLTIPWDRVR